MFVYKSVHCGDAPVGPQDPLSESIANAVVDGFVSTADEELILRDKEVTQRERWLKERCS